METATAVLAKAAPAEARAETATVALAQAVLVATREAMATVARDREETAVLRVETAMEAPDRVVRAVARAVPVGTKAAMVTEARAPVVWAVVKEARLVGVAARAARPPPREDLAAVTAPTQAALVGARAAIMEMEALVETKEARLVTRHCPALGTTGFLECSQVAPTTEEITAKALAVLMAPRVRLDLLDRQRQPLVATRSSLAAAGWDRLATVDATQSRVSLSIACIS